jgi:monoamine oxidase
MKSSRRDFLRFVVAGSVAAGCPVDLSLLDANEEKKSEIDGEHNTICHQVRDGHVFTRPPVSKRYEVVIVGGGISGLTAAYSLQKRNFLLLEKEPHFGGNAYLEEYEGQAYATGAAFDFLGSDTESLCSELGLKLLPIDCPDPTIVDGKWVPDTWRSGIDQLPYSAKVRDSFHKWKKQMLSLDVEAHPERFDNEPLTKYLHGYAPEIKKWWDAYGPSNWGADAANTSVWVAMDDFDDMTREPFHDTRVTLPGGNGVISAKLHEALAANHREQIVSGAAVVAVEPEKQGVNVTYYREGRVQTVAGRVVIMATPKFITSLLVAGLPPAQRNAMNALRYAPYPVVNLIFDKAIYERGYDTWCPGNCFTDFIPADWTVRNQPGYRPKNNILTFYTPLPEVERYRLLTIHGCQRIAANVLRDFQKLLPEFRDANPAEVRLYRRGHPMFLAAPGVYTKLMPAASHPMERVFFANTDSLGPESLTSAAVKMGRLGAEWAEKILAGKPAGALGTSAGVRP